MVSFLRVVDENLKSESSSVSTPYLDLIFQNGISRIVEYHLA